MTVDVKNFRTNVILFLNSKLFFILITHGKYIISHILILFSDFFSLKELDSFFSNIFFYFFFYSKHASYFSHFYVILSLFTD